VDDNLINTATSIVAAAAAPAAPANPHELMTLLVLQLAVIIIAAKLGGLLFRRFLRLPSVLGELVAGMLIGPYALGAVIPVPGIGPLFALTNPHYPVSSELQAISQIAAIILLFLSGLDTNLTVFLRYSVVGSLVGLGGVIFSFVLGDLCAVFFGVAHSFRDPQALFLGTISTATSVGITARVLAEKRKMSSPEGVTILAGAVIDDVLGIIVLAVVIGMTTLTRSGEQVHWGSISMVAVKAVGFWVICMTVGLLLARRLTGTLKHLRSPETIAGVSLGLALLLSGFSEMAGLAMIIGAYIMGLSLSRTDIVSLLQSHLQGLYDMLVPIFFCVMGMLVDVRATQQVLVFGLVYSLLAIIAKVVGCALPAYATQFNAHGALRIGLGMVPRGEVALIVAGIGLSSHTIGQDVFGVSILMTMITTFLAPPLLERSFARGGTGLKREVSAAEQEGTRSFQLEFPSADLAAFVLERLAQAFRDEDFYVFRLGQETQTYQIRKEAMVFSLSQEGQTILLTASEVNEHVARFIVLEELLELQDMARAFERLRDMDDMKNSLLKGLFDGGN